MPHARHPKPTPSHPAAPATFPDTVAEIAEGAANAAQRNEDIRTALRVQRLFQHVFLVNSPGDPIKPWLIGIGAFVAWLCDHSVEQGHVKGTPEQMREMMAEIVQGALDNAKAHK